MTRGAIESLPDELPKMKWHHMILVGSGVALLALLATRMPSLDQSGTGLTTVAIDKQKAGSAMVMPSMRVLPMLERAKMAAEKIRSVEIPEYAVAPIEERPGAVPATMSTQLEEWDIMRSTFNGPHAVSLSRLHCHAEINPSGRVLPEATVSALRECGESRLFALRELMEAVVLLRNQELAELATSGSLRPLRYSTRSEVVTDMDRVRRRSVALGINEEPLFTSSNYYEDAHALKWFTRSDGVNYGASDMDLRQYCLGMRLLAESVRDSYIQFVAIAGNGGAFGDDVTLLRFKKAEEWFVATHASFSP